MDCCCSNRVSVCHKGLAVNSASRHYIATIMKAITLSICFFLPWILRTSFVMIPFYKVNDSVLINKKALYRCIDCINLMGKLVFPCKSMTLCNNNMTFRRNNMRSCYCSLPLYRSRFVSLPPVWVKERGRAALSGGVVRSLQVMYIYDIRVWGGREWV